MNVKFVLKIMALGFSLLFLMGNEGCQTSDDIQREQQEKILAEGTAQTGMPAIKNFRERKLLKDIIEMRDQEGLVTYTYVLNHMTGKFVFVCDSIGYGIPYATQYTNPQKRDGGAVVIAQADPNGLYSPGSADGTWIMCKDPNSETVGPQYVEEKINVFTYRLPSWQVQADKPTGK